MDDSSSNKIIIDYLSFTSKSLSVKNLQCLLGLELENWEVGKAAYGFKKALYFHSIKIMYNFESLAELEFQKPFDSNLNDSEYLIWLDMSGQGCRAYETFGNGDFYGFFRFLLNQSDCNVTRLDVAFDDRTGILDIAELREYTENHWFVSKMHHGEVVFDWDRFKGKDYKAFTLYYGSKKSDIIIRIYDKAKERNRDNEHWIRVETQFRHDRARALASALLVKDIGSVYRGFLAEYLRFVEPSPDSNMRRWETLPAWDNLIAGVERVKLFEKVGIEYNLARLDNYVISMAGNASYTFLQVFGIERFLDELLNRVDVLKLNPNYKKILSDLQIDVNQNDWQNDIRNLRKVSSAYKLDKAQHYENDGALLLEELLKIAKTLTNE